MSSVQVQLGGNSVQVQVQSSGFARANAAIREAAASAASAAAYSAAVVYAVRSASFTAASQQRVLADTSASAWSMTLPLTPTVGARVEVIDSAFTFATNALTVLRNGQTIDDEAEDLIADVDGAAFSLTFNGSTWILEA